jgi:16S rRNA (cytidine1402-2'-O)-methyltransferase
MNKKGTTVTAGEKVARAEVAGGKGILYLLPCPIGEQTRPEDVLPAVNFEVMRGLDYFIVENVRSARRFLAAAGVAAGTAAGRSGSTGEGSGAAGVVSGVSGAGGSGAGGSGGSGVSGVAGDSGAAGVGSGSVAAGGGANVGSMDRLEFVELNEHTRPEEISAMIAPVLAGRDAGVISEAGVPAVADPGAEVVAAAHRAGVRVVPLVGPSSILMALMASGMNGQSFAFNGYLPVKPPERTRAIRHFERRAVAERQSQIFIETPYRGDKLFAEFLAACAPETRLCVAADVTGAGEYIRTMSIAEWRRGEAPVLAKRPAIFILG